MAIGYGEACPKPPTREKTARTRIRTHAKPKGERDRIATIRDYVRARERGRCRCCRFRHGQSMHELRPRSLGGKVSKRNSIWVCGDGVNGCHGFCQRRDIIVRCDELGAEGDILFTPESRAAAEWLKIKLGEQIVSPPMRDMEQE